MEYLEMLGIVVWRIKDMVEVKFFSLVRRDFIGVLMIGLIWLVREE